MLVGTRPHRHSQVAGQLGRQVIAARMLSSLPRRIAYVRGRGSLPELAHPHRRSCRSHHESSVSRRKHERIFGKGKANRAFSLLLKRRVSSLSRWGCAERAEDAKSNEQTPGFFPFEYMTPPTRIGAKLVSRVRSRQIRPLTSQTTQTAKPVRRLAVCLCKAL